MQQEEGDSMAVTYKDGQRMRFINRSDRFLHLLQLQAPQSVLEQEGGLIIRAVLGMVGPGAFAAVAESFIGNEKELAGLCRFHDDEDRPVSGARTPSGDSWGMCDDCLAQAREDGGGGEGTAEAEVASGRS
jgi:hypothetical protein